MGQKNNEDIGKATGALGKGSSPKTASKIASINVLDVYTYKLFSACERLSPKEITQAEKAELLQSDIHQ